MSDFVKLRRQGKFYNAYEEDAYVMHIIMGYKVSNGRVGFPVSVIGKIENMLTEKQVNYLVIDKDKEVSKGKFSKNNYKKYLDLGKKKYMVHKREDELVEKIRNLNEKQVFKIIKYIEEVCDE